MAHEPVPTGALTRRDRIRAETAAEIRQTARQILVEQGPDAVSLRAIAREMGMTAPALYRYFGSREELIRHVIGDLFTEVAADIDRAIAGTGAGGGPDALTAKMTAKMIAACQEFRRWSLGHQREFALIFGSPLPGVDDGRGDFADECGRRFAGTFFALFLELWQRRPFPVPPPPGIDPGLRVQLERFRGVLGTDIPAGALLAFLRCWVRLYGAVSMEVFGHLGFALDDAAPLFELTLSEMAASLGLHYQPGSWPASPQAGVPGPGAPGPGPGTGGAATGAPAAGR